MLVILFRKRVYYTSHLDMVSYPLEALCEMIVTLLDSSVSFFLFLLMGYLCLLLPHRLTNEYIISIFILSVASIFASRLITKYEGHLESF